MLAEQLLQKLKFSQNLGKKKSILGKYTGANEDEINKFVLKYVSEKNSLIT